jgi:hypothetical protein
MCLIGVIALGLITIVGSNGGEESKTSDTTPPEDVTSLSAQPGDGKVTLSWTASADSEGDLAGQKVYYSSHAGTTHTVAESALSGSKTTYEVTGLTNEIAYTFKVTCYDEVPNESSGATVSCTPTPTVEDDTILSNSDFPVQSGLADGGVARQSTQTMTGTVPNPTGSSDTYGGKAYLVLNGDMILLDVTKSVGGSGWTFSVTFSVNAGPNTICIEVYDLNDVFYAATSVWNIIGTIEPTSEENIYNVLLDDPDLTAFPTVELTVGVADSNSNPVEELTSANFYVANAGTSMSPMTVTDNGNGSYTLKYTDITSGRRDLYVYVYVPAEGGTPIKGGLSDTTTYGTNYALLVGLNEYPEAAMNNGEASWVEAPDPADDYVLVTPYYTPDRADDFTLIFEDIEGGTNWDDATVIPTMTHEGGYTYRLDFDKPANYNDYDRLTVMYKKQNWLSNCINDIVDLEAALKATATSMNNSSWEAANINRLEDSGATETAIVNKVAQIAGSMQKYDLFLFHFSGHGSGNPADGDASQYLCAYEDDSWISVTDLSNALDDIPKPGTNSYITNVFVFIDACHSGNFIGKGMERGFSAEVDRRKVRKFRPFIPQREEEPSGYRSLMFSRDLQDMTNKNNVFVMTAAAGDESSWDDGDLQNGVFTYYLVEGIDVTGRYISAGPANTNNDTRITAEEAFAYLDPKVEARVLSYAIGEVQDPQSQDNSTSTISRLIYNW